MATMIKNKGIKAPVFRKPDVSKFIPQGMEDAVARLTAAGMKIMYSPQMRQHVLQAIRSTVPTAKKLAGSAVGLLLTLDQRTPGGSPVAALFPAFLELLGEAAEVLSSAGQPVTQADYNEAVQTGMVIIAKKLGGSDQEIMQGLQQATQGAA